MDSRSVEHKATASCILSLQGESWGLPWLHYNLSSVLEDGEYERGKGEEVNGKTQVEQEEGLLDIFGLLHCSFFFSGWVKCP